MILQKIKNWKEENEKLEKIGKKAKKSPELFVSNAEWDNFIRKS